MIESVRTMPSLIVMVRWHLAAMLASWVTMRKVVRWFLFIYESSDMTSLDVLLSRFPVGSSQRMMDG